MSMEAIENCVDKDFNRQKKVLVMDDEKMVTEVVSMMLSELGYAVALSKDGDEAIEQYKNSKASGESFDVIILDLNIKDGIGGKEACRKLIEIDPSVICIASSGYPDGPVMTEFKRHGFKGSIAKPYSLNGLNEILQEVIGGNIK